MMPISRIGDHARNPVDSHACSDCPHDVRGPAQTGSPNVEVNGRRVVRLCDSGIHKTCCGKGQWNAIEGSATVLANGKPIVRKGDRSLHCGGGGSLIQGSGDCLAGGPTTLAVKDTPAKELVAYIHKEMVTNASGPHANFLRKKTSIIQLDNLMPGKMITDRIHALAEFATLTFPETEKDTLLEYVPILDKNTVSLWDHKSRIINAFGKCAFDAASGRAFRYDIWSNIHYGYIGRASGFTAFELKNGAGIAQLIPKKYKIASFKKYLNQKGGSMTRFDDPSDQAAIDIGIDLWDQYDHDVTEQDLLNAIRGSSGLAPCEKLNIGCT